MTERIKPPEIMEAKDIQQFITLEEKADRAKLLNLSRKPGGQSPQAKWQKDVRLLSDSDE
ncbi:MAG: hypothetical protein M3Q33_13730 [Acidobacteriota bacterium]|nr:hypothetical protein [Acidobacteriota bacterium]